VLQSIENPQGQAVSIDRLIQAVKGPKEKATALLSRQVFGQLDRAGQGVLPLSAF